MSDEQVSDEQVLPQECGDALRLAVLAAMNGPASTSWRTILARHERGGRS